MNIRILRLLQFRNNLDLTFPRVSKGFIKNIPVNAWSPEFLRDDIAIIQDIFYPCSGI